MDGWMDGGRDGRKNERTNRWVAWVDGWMDGGRKGEVEGEIERRKEEAFHRHWQIRESSSLENIKSSPKTYLFRVASSVK